MLGCIMRFQWTITNRPQNKKQRPRQVKVLITYYLLVTEAKILGRIKELLAHIFALLNLIQSIPCF